MLSSCRWSREESRVTAKFLVRSTGRSELPLPKRSPKKEKIWGGHIRNLVWYGMHLRCVLDVQAEMSSRRLDIEVWSAEEKDRLGIHIWWSFMYRCYSKP